MKKCFLITCLMAAVGTAIPSSLWSQSTGAFVRQGFGARGIGMGNAMVADVYGQASPFYNAALSPFVERQNVQASQGLLSLDRTLQFVQFAAPLRPKAGVAVGIVNAGVSGIDGRDNSGYHTREYSTTEFASFLNFGAKVGSKAALGLGLRFYRSDLAEDIKPEISIGLNIGLAIMVNDDLSIAFAVDDLLARYTWDSSGLYGDDGAQTSDQFPIRLRLGVGKRLMQKRLLLLAEYESQFESARVPTSRISIGGSSPTSIVDRDELRLQSNRIRLGAEYQLIEQFFVRGGIGQPSSTSIGTFNPSLGFSYLQELGQVGMKVDYAFRLDAYAIGATHIIGVSILL